MIPPALGYAKELSIEPIDDVPELTDEEAAGIQVAIESIRQGKGADVDAAKARIDRILGR